MTLLTTPSLGRRGVRTGGTRAVGVLPRRLRWRLLRLAEREALLTSSPDAATRGAAPPPGIALRPRPEAVALLESMLDPQRPAAESRDDTSHPALGPFVGWGAAEIDRWRSAPAAVAWDAVGPSLLRGLAGDLDAAAHRVFVLDRHVQRLRGSSEPTPARALLVRYAGLARMLADRCLAWRDRVERFLGALSSDVGRLEAVAGMPLGPVRLLEPLGEPLLRRRGWVVGFDAARWVLREGPPDVDVLVSETYDWLTARLRLTQAPRVPALDAGDRTWTLRPPAAPAGDPGLERDASYRLGVLAAGLHLAGATGLGPGDVAFVGGAPVLLDTGTVLDVSAGPAGSLAEHVLARSVLRIGLLDRHAAGDGCPPDLVPLGRGMPGPDDDPGSEPAWLALPPGDVLAGFEGACEAARADRWGLRSLLARRTDVRTPHPLRRARDYRRCLAHASHPDHLADAAAHEDALTRALGRSQPVRPAAEGTLAFERDALARGERPEPWRHLGAAARRRPPRLSVTSLAHGRRLLGDLTAPPRAVDQRALRPAEAAEPSWNDAGRQELLDTAVAIARALCATALRARGRSDWFGLQEDDRGRCLVKPAGPDLYHGQTGIAAFLAYAARASGERAFLDEAVRAVRGARYALLDGEYWAGGGFCGQASVAFGTLHVARVAGDEAMLADVQAAARRLDRPAGPLALLDLVGGDSGALAVVLAVHAATPDAELPAVAERLGRRILAGRTPARRGCAWPSGLGRSGLSGFAHGNAGITWTLARLAAAGIGDGAAIRDTVEGGLAFERSLWSDEHRNWLDLRAPRGQVVPAQPTAALAWCHGAPGIGLSRATLPDDFFGPAEREDLVRAVAAVDERDLEPTDCLCHGELGNLETLLLAAARLGTEWIEVARRRGLGAARRARARGGPVEGWTCGIAAHASTPGFLVGLAGMGYGLLRLFDPAAHPSLLALETPR
jgi:hypothetical protein